MSAETRIVVIDELAVLRDGLQQVLEPYDINVVGSSTPDNGAVELVQTQQPDVVVVNVGPDKNDPIELIRELSRKRQNVIAWAQNDNERLVVRALAAGARGVAVKDNDTEAFVEGLRTVAGGRRWLPTEASDEEIDDLLTNGQPQLSRRESEILGLLADGYSTDGVAEHLSLSAHTVRTHVKNAMRKLGASTRAHAIAIAMRELAIR